MTNYKHGRLAEAAAAQYLQARNYEILVKNWRTRYCEIDIVARKEREVYFVEVKYRRSNRQGSGLDYITPTKLKQMELAARFWVANKGWQGGSHLSAIEVSGPSYTVTEFLADLM